MPNLKVSSREFLAGSPWSRKKTAQGFTQSAPNPAPLAFAEAEPQDWAGVTACSTLAVGGPKTPFLRRDSVERSWRLSFPSDNRRGASRIVHPLEFDRLRVLAPIAAFWCKQVVPTPLVGVGRTRLLVCTPFCVSQDERDRDVPLVAYGRRLGFLRPVRWRWPSSSCPCHRLHTGEPAAVTGR